MPCTFVWYLQVVALRRAIRKGLIKFEKPKEEPRVYLLWGDESDATEKSGHLAYIPAPKPKLPGNADHFSGLGFYFVINIVKVLWIKKYDDFCFQATRSRTIPLWNTSQHKKRLILIS